MSKIAIIYYGMGNLHSVERALRHVVPDDEVYLATTASDIAKADRVVLPGQGAMQDCMKNLASSGLLEPTLQALATKPLLGICVGEQMLVSHSEEGDSVCLNVYPGEVKRFAGPAFEVQADSSANRLKVPHMGWSQVRQTVEHPLWQGIAQDAYFYFVHSYYVVVQNPALTAAVTHYGHEFTCALAHENVFAVQFHPEKSAQDGLRLLYNFTQWQP